MKNNGEMPLRRLGNSGLIVSRIALGTMMFGGRTAEAEAREIFASAADAGVNFIDTADTYAEGRSEEITGRALAGDRHRYVLATKLANPAGPGAERSRPVAQVDHGGGRAQPEAAADRLRRHPLSAQGGQPARRWRRRSAPSPICSAPGRSAISASPTYRAWRIARICAICDAEGIDRPVVCQPLYHALNRTIEVEVLPACAALGIGVAVYSPTARGVLSGKYAKGAPPPEGSRAAVQNQRMLQTEFQPAALDAAEALAAHARARGIEPAAFATAWVLANPIVTAAIAGPRTMEQWLSYLKAVDVAWTAEDEAVVDKLVPAGTTAVHQFIDPIYPVEGRPACRAARREAKHDHNADFSAGRAARTSPRSPPSRPRRCTRRSARRGAMPFAIKPIYQGMRVCGPALTVDCTPGDNLAIHVAVEQAEPGDVLVVDYKGFLEAGPFGDVLATACLRRGHRRAGDRRLRARRADAQGDAVPGVRARAQHEGHRQERGRARSACRSSAPACAVSPGDVVVGDDDGVVVVPREKIAAAAKRGARARRQGGGHARAAQGRRDDGRPARAVGARAQRRFAREHVAGAIRPRCVRAQIEAVLRAWGMPRGQDPRHRRRDGRDRPHGRRLARHLDADPLRADAEGRAAAARRRAEDRARRRATTALIDGGAGLGHPVSVMAMQLAVEKALAHDIGAVSVFNSHHFGACGYLRAHGDAQGPDRHRLLVEPHRHRRADARRGAGARHEPAVLRGAGRAAAAGRCSTCRPASSPPTRSRSMR